MSTKFEVVAVLALAAVIFAAGCGDAKSESAAAPLPAPVISTAAAPPVNAPAVSAPPEDGVTASGPLIVEHQLEIAAQTPGVISKVYVEAGTRVKAGALLAQIDDRQVTANLEAARAKTRSIENDLKNWQAEAEVVIWCRSHAVFHA